MVLVLPAEDDPMTDPYCLPCAAPMDRIHEFSGDLALFQCAACKTVAVSRWPH